MKLVIQSEVLENNAIHEPSANRNKKDGVPSEWERKTSEYFIVENYQFTTIEQLKLDVQLLSKKIVKDNDHSKVSIVNFELVEDNWVSDFEEFQKKYNGKIRFPAKKIVLPEKEVDIGAKSEWNSVDLEM